MQTSWPFRPTSTSVFSNCTEVMVPNSRLSARGRTNGQGVSASRRCDICAHHMQARTKPTRYPGKQLCFVPLEGTQMGVPERTRPSSTRTPTMMGSRREKMYSGKIFRRQGKIATRRYFSRNCCLTSYESGRVVRRMNACQEKKSCCRRPPRWQFGCQKHNSHFRRIPIHHGHVVRALTSMWRRNISSK